MRTSPFARIHHTAHEARDEVMNRPFGSEGRGIAAVKRRRQTYLIPLGLGRLGERDGRIEIGTLLRNWQQIRKIGDIDLFRLQLLKKEKQQLHLCPHSQAEPMRFRNSRSATSCP